MNHDKSQITRLIDVFLLGPFIIWYAIQYEYTNKNQKVSPIHFYIMIFIGIATIVYNGYNYLSHYIALPPLPL
jgi:uncharacterized membrane protein YadS